MAYQEVAQDRPALPEYLARKSKGPMDDDDFRQVVQNGLMQSVQFIDTEMSVERGRATEYYLGKPFGNEEEGRSQVILTEVRDAVDGMLPSLMRIFFGAEHAVEYAPKRPEMVAAAEQATDYVRHVFEEENAGFLKALQVLKDGLIRKIGIFKWWWDGSQDTKSYRMEGLDDIALKQLAANDDVELVKVVKREDGLNDVDLTRTQKGGRACVEALPPEEFIYNRQARSPNTDDGTLLILAHRTDKTRGQLLAMGIKEKDIDEHAGAGNTTDVTLKGNAEEIARRDVAGVGRVVGFGYTTDPEMGPENSKILYCEALMRIDYDGDGIAEWRRVCTIGPTYYPVENRPADDSMGFAVFTPYPEPHTLVGGSVADRTMDVQKINSALLRTMLDSFALSVYPRTAYQEGQVSVADIMNTAIGAPIRTRSVPNQVLQEFTHTFTGRDAMPIMQFMQEVIERRTGQEKGAAGLDADALQSTDKDAVNAVLQGGREQVELIARIFAEMTLKPLFVGLYKLLQSYQPRARMVRLRGTWTPVDPRTWDADCDVTVNVALGTTNTAQKIQTLMDVAADQTNWIQQFGPTNPVATVPMLRNTKAKILALRGIKNVNDFYQPLPMDWQPPPPPPPPPDPEVLAMQNEQQMNHLKTVKELAIQQDRLAMEREQNERNWQYKYDELAANIALKREVALIQFGGNLSQQQSDADVQEAKLTLMAHDQLHDQALERQAQDHAQGLAEDAQAHDQMLAEQQANQPEDSEASE